MAMTQETRRCKVVKSPLKDDALFLTALDARERVSGPFQFDCRFVSHDEQIDFKKVIGQSIALEIEMAKGESRFFHGLVARFSQADAEATGAIYHAQLVPWFWFLSRRTDCRIFQGDTVVQILEKVFAKHKQIANYELVKDSYDPIPYCVQYRESDFHFASRLMEEWGIGYYFEHTQKAHKMILWNDAGKIVACPGQAKASANNDPKTPGNVFDWRVQQEFRSGAYALTDYNYRDPGLDLGVQKKTPAGVGGNEAYEIYDYPGSYQALGAGDKRVQLRIEAEECASHAIAGNSTCFGFTPGYKFDLTGHARASYNTAYLLTEVHHTFSQNVGGGRGGAGTDYRNAFVCVPHAIPYRPPLVTPKPVIQGVQTATVVGEGSKEIDIDELGCVVVKFHWDRLAKGDASSSCRIRVSEAWGGKNYGSFFAPRIGQEVIVEFLEGDPDRPIITGRVYNGTQTPPYTNGEHMGIKSQSTPKGGAANYNEIRLEDSKGNERVYIQAEKDMKVLVKNNEDRTVLANKTEQVTENKTVGVGGDLGETVSGMRTSTVTLLSAETVGLAKAMTCGAAYQVSVGAIMNTTVIGAKLEEVGLFRMTAVGGTSTEKVRGKKKINSGGDMTLATKKVLNLTADDQGALRTKKKLEIASEDVLFIDAKKSIVIESETDVILRAGKAQIILKKDGGVVEIQGTDIKIDGTSSVKVKGGKVSIN